jgi:anti-sigma B factor antagonist
MRETNLEAEATRDGGVVVYRLRGSLHGTAAGYAFQETVRREVASGTTRVAVDLGGVERIDSSGIGILVAIMFSTSNAGGKLVLSSVPERVSKALGIAMLLDRIEQAPTADDALARLRG